MNRVEPTMARMRVPGLARVVFPRGLQFLECAIASRLPGDVDQQLCERAQSLFAPALFFVMSLAFDEVGGEPRQDVEQPQVALRRHMRSLPMCRDHSDDLATARQQRCGLRG